MVQGTIQIKMWTCCVKYKSQYFRPEALTETSLPVTEAVWLAPVEDAVTGPDFKERAGTTLVTYMVKRWEKEVIILQHE